MEVSIVKESPKCAGCLNNIGDHDYVSALGQDWHKDCFRCSVCDIMLSTWYFEKNGLLFCQPDYWARYGESCQQCTQVITGPVMAAGSHRFHPECFACGECGAPIEDSEPYALVERTQLYCGGCYSSSAGAHSIRVVAVPSSAVRAAPSPRDPATLTVTEFDSSCGVVTLHIGDRILEINGAPARASALDVRPPTLLQLTIEHNPETTTKNSKRIMCNILSDQPRDRPTETRINHNEEFINAELGSEAKTSELETGQRGQRGVDKRERLFKRKGEDGGASRLIKRRQVPTSPLLGEKERSSSMSKLLDVSEDTKETNGVLCDLSRARSFRAEPAPAQKVFRACDLIQGELLGSGFFGEVYKVTHRATNEVMVLKQLYRVDDDAQKNFLKEVAVLRSLSHPNVLKFVGVVYKDKRLHLVTEYVAGGTLHQLIQDSSVSLGWRARARLARDVAAGVGYLHRRNVIHRDLNSHNCLVREDLTVIVADFGLARIVQRTASSTLQRTSHHNSTLRRKRYTVVGNPYWMAPEMMNGKVYDEKVDVFSFGVILCEIIGRVSADPDFLPRRSDFGLNETLFIEKFCRHTACPEPFYRVAFRACQLDPDARPPFEVIEIWLESLVMDLSRPGPLPPTLLADILQYAHSPHCGPSTPECQHDVCCHTCQNCQNLQTGCQHLQIAIQVPCQRNGKNKSCCQEDTCCHCQTTYSQQQQCCVHAYTYQDSQQMCSQCANGQRKDACRQTNGQQEKCCQHSCGSGCGGVIERNCGCRVRRMPSNAGSEDLVPDAGVIKSKSNATIEFAVCRSESRRGGALGKCVSASHITPLVTVSSRTLSRSQNALANPGFILRAVGQSINITQVDDITEWLDSPPPLKRTSPDSQLNKLLEDKSRNVDETDLPAFLRNQSVEGLESQCKQDMDTPPLCRHISMTSSPPCECEDSDSSDDEYIDCNWYKNVSNSKKMDVDAKNVIANIIKKSESLLPKKSSYDVADVMLRNPECLTSERKIPEEDQRRYNIDYMRQSPAMAEGLKHIPKTVDVQNKPEKTNFFTKNLRSPKLSRLLEAVRSKPENDDKEEKSRSKFFIQRPLSPIGRSSYRVRPVDENEKKRVNTDKKNQNNVLKSDLKLASMGKPMTPTFRRHLPNERPDFADSRFSYRVSRSKFEPKNEPKFVDIGRNRIKAPLPIEKRIRNAQNNQTSTQNNQTSTQNNQTSTQNNQTSTQNNQTSTQNNQTSTQNNQTSTQNNQTSTQNNKTSTQNTQIQSTPNARPFSVKHKNPPEDDKLKRREGISRSNYVSLANLKINSKSLDDNRQTEGHSPVERVI